MAKIKFKKIIAEHNLGILPSEKLLKMKWNPLTEAEPDAEPIEEDRFGHPITALGNQIYIQLDKMEQLLSGKEKNNYMRARSTFWKITKAAMESEEQK